MEFAIWLHPKGHVVGASSTLVANTGRLYVFNSHWDHTQRFNLTLKLVDPRERDLCHDLWQAEGYRLIGHYDGLDERESALRNAIDALLVAFDTQRDPKFRDTSRYLVPFRRVLNVMLEFSDDPEGYILPYGPLPPLTLFVGKPKHSRYDFWEAR